MGPPPQLQKGLSMHPTGMNNNGPVKAHDMGYDKQSYGGQSNMKAGPTGNSGFGHYNNDFGGSKESTAYTNSNYRKPFNPSNMQTPSSHASFSPGIQSNYSG